MVRIPRFEPQVAPAMQDQPFSSGDGYSAPGRAMQQLGSGLASFGAGLDSMAAKADAEAEKENSYLDQLKLFELQREAEDSYGKFKESVEADPDYDYKDYVQRAQDVTAQVYGRFQGSSKAFTGPRGQLTIAKLSDPTRFHTDYRVGRDRHVTNVVERTLQQRWTDFGIEVEKRGTAAPRPGELLRDEDAQPMTQEEYTQRFEAKINELDTVLRGAPPQARRALEAKAAALAKAELEARQGWELPAAREMLERWSKGTPEREVPTRERPGPGASVDPSELNKRVTPQEFFGPEVDVNKLPLGMRASNNPTNIKYSGSAWQKENFPGLVGPSSAKDEGDPQALFANPLAGMAAGARLALTKQSQGLDTLEKIMGDPKLGWSPNHKKSAVSTMARETGWSPTEKFDLRQPEQMQKFMRALIATEHGPSGKLYSDDLVRKGVEVALGGGNQQQASGGVRPASAGEYLTAKLAKGYESRKSDVANLHPVMQDRLAAFVAAAEDQGHDIRVLSGHRDAARQAVLWEQALKKYGSAEAARKWVAPPGTSTHSTGEAVDLQYGDRGGGLGGKKTAAVAWAHENAAKYGLHFPLGHEDWHIEPNEARAGGKRHSGQYASGAPMYQGGGRMAAGGPSEPVPVAQRGITAGMRPNNTVPEGQPTATDARSNNTIPVPGERYAQAQIGSEARVAGSTQTSESVQVAQLAPEQRRDEQGSGPSVAPDVGRGLHGIRGVLSEMILKDKDEMAKRHLKHMEAEASRQRFEGFIAGTVPFNPYDDEDKKIVDKTFEAAKLGRQIFEGNPTAVSWTVAAAQKLNHIPKDVAQGFRGLVNAKEPAKRVLGYEAIQSILQRNPNGFEEGDDAKKLKSEAQDYSALRQSGKTVEESLLRIDEMKSPDWQKRTEAHKKTAEVNLKTFTVADIGKWFDTNYLPFTDPAVIDGQMALIAYQDAYKEHFTRTGDDTIAKYHAEAAIKKTWGVSTIRGTKEVMQFPPERSYPMVWNPETKSYDHGYLARDIEMAVRQRLAGEKIAIGSIQLKADSRTAADVTNGRPPRYHLTYTTPEGKHVYVPGMWGLTAADVKDAQAAGEAKANEHRRKTLTEPPPTMLDRTLKERNREQMMGPR